MLVMTLDGLSRGLLAMAEGVLGLVLAAVLMLLRAVATLFACVVGVIAFAAAVVVFAVVLVCSTWSLLFGRTRQVEIDGVVWERGRWPWEWSRAAAMVEDGDG